MSRYIEAEWLSELFPDTGEGDWTYNATAQGYIDSAPSVDIIRCGKCKRWVDDRKSEDDMGTCGLTHYFTNADDFCSYGERKDE